MEEPSYRIQVVHEFQSHSYPYPDDVEQALKNITFGRSGLFPLTEDEKEEYMIRHETGPEINPLCFHC